MFAVVFDDAANVFLNTSSDPSLIIAVNSG